MQRRYIIAASALALCFVFAAIGYLALAPDETSDRRVETYIGDVRLTIPSAYFRFEHALSGGKLPEIDLAADAKTFRPAKLLRKFRTDGPDPLAQTVFLTIMPPEGKLQPAERTTRLYGRFLQADGWSHPGGLIMRRFVDGSPYEHEDLYMAPPEGRVFAARCTRPRKTPDGLPNTCIAEVRIDGVDVRARFSPDLLSEWEHLLAGIRGLLQSFRR